VKDEIHPFAHISIGLNKYFPSTFHPSFIYFSFSVHVLFSIGNIVLQSIRYDNFSRVDIKASEFIEWLFKKRTNSLYHFTNSL
jgi:hypothetical protein